MSAASTPYCYGPGGTATTRIFTATAQLTAIHYHVTPMPPGCAPLPTNAIFSNMDLLYGKSFTAPFPTLVSDNGPYDGDFVVQGLYPGFEDAVYDAMSVGGSCAPVPLGTPHALASPLQAAVSATAGLAFDLSSLANHKVYEAMLLVDKQSQTSFDPIPSNGFPAGHYVDVQRFAYAQTPGNPDVCQFLPGVATQAWQSGAATGHMGSTPLSGNLVAVPNSHGTFSPGFDVTSTVAGWASHADGGDNGFILNPGMQVPPDGIASERLLGGCIANVATPALSVTYF